MLKFDYTTGSVALRSTYPEDAWNAWFVGDPTAGGHWAPSNQVEDWTDVPIPPKETL